MNRQWVPVASDDHELFDEIVENGRYDPDRNARDCYALAIREIRLAGIRSGKYAPRPDNEEEVRTLVDALPKAHRGQQ